MNAVEIEQAISELAEHPFDRAEFPFAFLEAFGNKATTLKKLRSGASNASDLPGGVLQRSNIHIATCDAGTVDQTLKALRESPKTAAAKAKFILATDGADFQAEDLNSGETVACTFADFPNHFGLFLPLAGITTVKQIRESTFDIRATSRLNKLYVELLKDNPEWATAERRADMNHFMARLIFCFFAEDTDIFNGEGLFTRTVDQMSARDSGNTHEVISQIFQAMDTPTRHEGKLDERYRKAAGTPRWADVFPYVNGQLFSGNTDVPRFSRIARSYLIQIGNLNWKKINPDIFGSMIQAVADDEERGALGMHYTSVPNILKVLNPLFLDDLRKALDEAGDNARKLLNLRHRMARIRVFDPACGSGNFLVIAYKQMREIEAEINLRRGEAHRKTAIPLTNFRGIELREFPAEIARLALIIAEFQCDVLYRGQKEALADFLPLDSQNWITCGNALRLDWLSLCPPTGSGVRMQAHDLFETPLDQAEIDFENEGGEIFVCGNPPYIGGKKQNAAQKSDMKAIFANEPKFKNLDYICAFLVKTGIYLQYYDRAAIVTTNSISQGTHVPVLWPILEKLGCIVEFSYETFKWQNNAQNNAGVSVTIVGLTRHLVSEKFIYNDQSRRKVTNINAYLIDGPQVIVESESKPINSLSPMITGNAAYDGGNLFLNSMEAKAISQRYPVVSKSIRPVTGTSEFIDGILRYCLWIDDQDLTEFMQFPEIAERIEKVRKAREDGGEVAITLVDRSHQFRFRNTSKRLQIVVPQVSSEKREYLPVGLLSKEFIITHLAHAIYTPTMVDLSILMSKLHLAWISTVCGKLETRLRYASNLGWNTFPVPTLTEQNKADLTRCAEDILLAREAHFPKTIAELYDPEKMPENLRHAHERNDEVLERIYIGRKFRNDTERLEKLFELYTKMTGKKAA
ncbi:class I SAM-dependent DNA methyltransferase [Sphingopyxis sp. FD7]|uniref:class I SAM-dependent DNA methyltransferase n=1 Tax=Sphingopyxis sp. FD7 TaxID=1914525 RepID=UPI000DC62AB4|nr:DNA methyltransferase [Sphingopyxis sp. FD7]BBB14234.1 DNA methylase [Sphingopyxis sp. FD7]